jgi:hypothetical protein
MPKHILAVLCLSVLGAPAAFAGVSVSSPSNGATIQGSVHYTASANTSCGRGIGAMGVYTAPGVLAYVVNGSSLNTNLNLDPGTYKTVVEAWDNCGGASTSTVTVTVNSGPGVFVTSPGNNGTVSSPVIFAATATTSCSKGIGSMGIYTAPYKLAYAGQGANLKTSLALSPGKYNVVVQEWDNCGGSTTKPVTITVGGSHGFTNLQKSGGWTGFGQGPPKFIDCNPCGSQISWSMIQGIQSPSTSGASTKYNIGGKGPYWDVLFNNHLIGDLSSQGMPDSNHSLVPTLHNFTYDVYFFGANLGAAQAVEFDLNQFFDGMGFIWGHECRIAGGNEWDIWDNVNEKWVPTGVSCKPNNNAWNHLTLQVQRTSNNQLLYQSITLNGVTHTLNTYYNPGRTPGWYGVTVNYQMDGDSQQTPYEVFLDQLTFNYD